MIKPTVGRVVHFTPSVHGDNRKDPNQPYVGLITYVHNDRLVNLVAFDHNGNGNAYTSVTLLQDNDTRPDHGAVANWMEYQKGQAAKTEALEAESKAKPPQVPPSSGKKA